MGENVMAATDSLKRPACSFKLCNQFSALHTTSSF